MNFEEQYKDVLQNIEFGIVSVYGQAPEMVDYDVERVLQALQRAYRGEQQRKEAPDFQFNELRQQMFASVRIICKCRLVSATLGDEKTGRLNPKPITIDEVVACLKRIERSVKTWNKRGGIRGYLNFVEQYVM